MGGLSTAPNSLHEKVGAAYKMLKGLREDAMSSGGAVKNYDGGGAVEDDMPSRFGTEAGYDVAEDIMSPTRHSSAIAYAGTPSGPSVPAGLGM